MLACLRNGTIAASEKQTFDDYYNNYLLLQLTKMRGQPALEFPTFHKALRIDFANASRGNAARDRLNELTLAFMKKVYSSPSQELDFPVRYNALLIITELNERDSPPSPMRRPCP